MPTRSNKINIIIGMRDAGKTYLLKKLLTEYEHKKSFPKQLIVDTYDNPVWRKFDIIYLNELQRWKEGKCRIFDSDTALIIEYLVEYCYNTVICFEDATKFIDPKLTKKQKSLILDSKQKNNDMYLLFHYHVACPRDLFRIADKVTIFKTNESFENSLRFRWVNPEIEQAFYRVQDHKNIHYCETINIRK